MALILHLSPGEVRNRNGIIPSGSYIRHASVGIVTSPWGDAFDLSVASVPTGVVVPVAQIPGLLGTTGTLLIRCKASNSGTNNIFNFGSSTVPQQRFTLTSSTTANRLIAAYRTAVGAGSTSNLNEVSGNNWIWVAFRWWKGALRIQGPTQTLNWGNNTDGPFTGNLSLGNSAARAVQVSNVLLFDHAIDDAMLAKINAVTNWTWDAVEELITPVPVIPAYDSGITSVEVETYITDRNNVSRTPLGDALLRVAPDWDVDRSGAKSRVEVQTHLGMLEQDMWVAPEITITPEVGEVITQQIGHFRLGQPGITYSGMYLSESGERQKIQVAQGSDIVDDLALALLPETFYTPEGGDIIQDVRVLVQMATSGIMGPNLVPNGSFESGLTDWNTTWNLGGANVETNIITHAWTGSEQPEGVQSLEMQFTTSAVAGNYRNPYTDIAVPSGAQFMYINVLFRLPSGEIKSRIRPEWRDASGTIDFIQVDAVATNAGTNFWTRNFIVVPVHPNATTLRVALMNELVVTTGVDALCGWDDLRVGTCTMMPLPVSRIQLPAFSKVASKRIQTPQGRSYAYHAINADRLNSIAYYAIATRLDGQLTSQPVQCLDHATVVATYGADDYSLVDQVTVSPSMPNTPNHFQAIREDPEDGNNTIVANAYNNDPNDPSSVVVSGRVITAPQIQVSDAVSITELQAIADVARDRASVQQEATIQIRPNPRLALRNVIMIDDPTMPELQGRWGIESIRPSLDPRNPIVTLGCRRTRGSGVCNG